MKTFLTVLLVIAHIAAAAQEKQSLTPEDIATIQAEKMQQILELTPDQKGAVFEINLDVAKRNAAIILDETDAESIARERSVLRNEQINRINGILTPEQKKKFEAANERYRAKKIERENRKE